jgi:formylglycine-generating enzyme required for sulfatase activity
MKLPVFFTLLLPMALLIVLSSDDAWSQPRQLEIPAGSFHSVLPEVVGEPIEVESFYLDETAVTNQAFQKFLIENPRWTPSEIPTLYAESGYLKNWGDGISYDDKTIDDQPVTRVSWYAANAYCGWQGGRLPTLNEWEYAAQAMDFKSPTEADQFSLDLIGWYSAVDANQPSAVGSTGIENRYGVKDMFGLVMEWVEDFKPPIADNLSLDCGTVGRMQGTSSMYGYAMSIRYITRMSFKPTSTTGMLGFRCAYDAPSKSDRTPVEQGREIENRLNN